MEATPPAMACGFERNTDALMYEACGLLLSYCYFFFSESVVFILKGPSINGS